MIRVLIADAFLDFQISESFAKWLNFDPDFEPIGIIWLFDEDRIQKIRTANPDVLIARIGAYNAANEDMIDRIAHIVYELTSCSVIVIAVNDDVDVIQN